MEDLMEKIRSHCCSVATPTCDLTVWRRWLRLCMFSWWDLKLYSTDLQIFGRTAL